MPTNATPQSNNPVRQFPVRVALWLAFLCAVAAPLSAKVAQTTYAQRLIDLTLLKHPDLMVAAMHVTAPGASDNVVIAANLKSLLGEKSDGDDLTPLTTDKPIGAPTKDRSKYEVILPLRDAQDRTVGTLVVVTKFEDGPLAAAHRLDQATLVRNQLAQVVPSLESLFEPFDLGTEATDTLAQKLTVAAAVRHPDMLVLALHLKAPGEADYKIWATNRPKVMGSVEHDDSDINVSEKGQSLWTFYGPVHRMLAELPLRAADGSVCGALVMVALGRDEDDVAPFVARALAVRDELQNQIPGQSALFKP